MVANELVLTAVLLQWLLPDFPMENPLLNAIFVIFVMAWFWLNKNHWKLKNFSSTNKKTLHEKHNFHFTSFVPQFCKWAN